MPSKRKSAPGKTKVGSRSSNAPGSAKPKSGQKGASTPGKTKPPKPSTPFQHITEMVKWVDLVIEVLDARVPLCTRHPRADEIFGRKPRLLVFAKADLADADATRRLLESVEENTGFPCLLVSLKNSSSKGQIMSACIEATKERLQSLINKGLLPRPMRVCIVGLPNVGKSSLINWLIGEKRTRVGNQPGVTRGTQWVRVHPKLELMDTPGILPPAAFPPPVKNKLAICNLIPDSNYDQLEIAQIALESLKTKYPRMLDAYIEGLSADDAGLVDIATARNLLTSGAKPDIHRAGALFLSELRDGRVGRFTLDP